MASLFKPLPVKTTEGEDEIKQEKCQTETKPSKEIIFCNSIQKKLIMDNKLIINSKYLNIYIILYLLIYLINNELDFLNIKRKKYSMFSSEVKKKCIEAVKYDYIYTNNPILI